MKKLLLVVFAICGCILYSSLSFAQEKSKTFVYTSKNRPVSQEQGKMCNFQLTFPNTERWLHFKLERYGSNGEKIDERVHKNHTKEYA